MNDIQRALLQRAQPTFSSWSNTRIAIVTAIVIAILAGSSLLFHFKGIGGMALPIVLASLAFITLLIGIVLIIKNTSKDSSTETQRLPAFEKIEHVQITTTKLNEPEAITPEPCADLTSQTLESSVPLISSFYNKMSLNLMRLKTEERIELANMVLNNTLHFFSRYKEFQEEFSHYQLVDILEKAIENLEQGDFLKMEKYVLAGLEENPDAVLKIVQKNEIFHTKIMEKIEDVKDLKKRDDIQALVTKSL